MKPILLIALGLAIVGVVPLVGLPGYFWGISAGRIVDLLFGAHTYDALLARLNASSWALAIGIALLWPLALIPAYLAARAGAGAAWSAGGVAIFAAVTVVLASAIATVVTLLTLLATPVGAGDRFQAAVAADDAAFVTKHFAAISAPPALAAAFYQAIGAGAEDVALILLAKGAPAGGTPERDKPLLLAAGRGLGRLIEGLLAHGVAIDERDAAGRTVVHFALGDDDRHDPAFLRFLSAKGADFKAVDAQGRTPLIALAQGVALVGWDRDYGAAMLALGVDRGAKDSGGKTALEYAKAHFHDDLAALLER